MESRKHFQLQSMSGHLPAEARRILLALKGAIESQLVLVVPHHRYQHFLPSLSMPIRRFYFIKAPDLLPDSILNHMRGIAFSLSGAA